MMHRAIFFQKLICRYTVICLVTLKQVMELKFKCPHCETGEKTLFTIQSTTIQSS